MLKYQNPSQTLQRRARQGGRAQRASWPTQGVRIVPYIDRDDLVHATIHKVGHTILEGIALVFLMLILFLGSPRSAFVVAVSIPLALVSVFSLLNLTHVSANLLSLGAIDFGILVDGAIVVTEAVLRRREAMPNEELSESEAQGGDAAGDAADLLRQPHHHHGLSAAVLLRARRGEAVHAHGLHHGLCAVRRPADRAGAGAGPGLFGLPQARAGSITTAGWRRLTVCYDRVLAPAWSSRASSTAWSIFALLAVVGLGGTVGRDFLPDLDEGALWLQVQMPTGSGPEQGQRHGERPAAGDSQVSGSLLRRHADRPQ